MPRLDPVWRPKRGPPEREITSSLNIKSEKTSVPFCVSVVPYHRLRNSAQAARNHRAPSKLLPFVHPGL